jgi:uncharacterized membrane protein
MIAWLLVIHIFGLVLWISGLMTATIVLSQLAQEATAEGRVALARVQRVLLRALADPGAVITLAAGLAIAATNSPYYFHAHWLQIKLAFVVILIILHVMIAIRGKSAAAGGVVLDAGQVRILRLMVIFVFFSILVATLPGEVFLK